MSIYTVGNNYKLSTKKVIIIRSAWESNLNLIELCMLQSIILMGSGLLLEFQHNICMDTDWFRRLLISTEHSFKCETMTEVGRGRCGVMLLHF